MCSLNVRFSQSSDRKGVLNYALTVEVVSSEGIPGKIFVYHQMPAGLDGNTFAEFDHIATPVDFQEIPEDAASEIVPWYRTNKCTVWFRNLSDLKTAKQMFVDDISDLQRNFDILTSENDFSSQTTLEFSGGTVGVVSSAVLAVAFALSSLCSFGAGVSSADLNKLDLDTNPTVVTNVSFDGLATSSDLAAAISTNNPAFVSAVNDTPVAVPDGFDMGDFAGYGTVGALIIAMVSAISWLKGKVGDIEDDLEEGYTEWTVVPSTYENGKPVVVAKITEGEDSLGYWTVFLEEVAVHSIHNALAVPIDDDDATSLSWMGGDSWGNGVSATRRVITPTKTSQLTNNGDGTSAFATVSQLPSVPSASTSTPQMDGTGSAGTATAWARGDHVHPSDTNKADVNDLPYALVTPGEWQFSGSDVQSGVAYTIDIYEDSLNPGFWDYDIYADGVYLDSVSGDTATPSSIEFQNTNITATYTGIVLLDRAVNAVSVTGATEITLPSLITGKSRDLLVRMTVTADSAVTFSAQTGETVTWDDAGSPTATYEACVHLLRFTEISQGLFHFDDLGNAAIDPSVLAAKLDATSAAPAFNQTKTYSVGEYVTYEGVLYECSTAVTTAGAWTGSTNWTARDMTTPDATLDIMADGRLRLVSSAGTVLWMQGYSLASASSVSLSCEKVNYYAFSAGTLTAAFTMPTAPYGMVGDFVLDIDNSANASDIATATLTGAGTAFDIYTANGENVSTDVLTFAGGEQCELYFTMTAFGTTAKPAWKVVKQVVEKQEFGS